MQIHSQSQTSLTTYITLLLNNNTYLMASFLGQPGKVAPEK